MFQIVYAPSVYTGCLRALFPVPVALSAALAFGAWAGFAQTKSTAKSTAKATAKSTTKPAARKTAAPAKTAAKAAPATKSTAKKKAAVVVHHAQAQPTPERYKEIQQALADKGYFKAEPDGNWGPASIEALKHFQRDQKLVEDGKIGALSLIALGLGPKYEPPKAAESEQKIP